MQIKRQVIGHNCQETKKGYNEVPLFLLFEENSYFSKKFQLFKFKMKIFSYH